MDERLNKSVPVFSGWHINRHQIRAGDELFKCFEENKLPEDSQKINPAIKVTNGVHGAIVDMVVETTAETKRTGTFSVPLASC